MKPTREQKRGIMRYVIAQGQVDLELRKFEAAERGMFKEVLRRAVIIGDLVRRRAIAGVKAKEKANEGR